MQSVSFVLKNSPIALSFNFRHYKDAEDLFKKAKTETLAFLNKSPAAFTSIEIVDDFDTKALIFLSDVSAITLTEYAKDMKKNGELQLLQAKADLQTQSSAKSDIGLRMLGDAANRDDLLPGEKKILKA